LRQVARAAAHDARLGDSFCRDMHGRADCVAIRFCSDEPQTQAAISGRLIIAIKLRRAVICRQQ
jgi:hypothetical protein